MNSTKVGPIKTCVLPLPLLAIALLFAACGGTGSSPSETQTTFPSNVSITKVATLPEEIRETSGLAYIEGRLYTHNDSGGSPWLYEINVTNGTIIRTIIVNGANNVDWEDLAVDQQYLYIADTGNNNHNRISLQIYKISINDLAHNDSVYADTIEFTYEDQGTTAPYDTEAIIAKNGKLFLFTKALSDYKSRLYTLNPTPGTRFATFKNEHQFDVAITGGAMLETNSSAVLLGYNTNVNDFLIQLIRLDDFNETDMFSGTIAVQNIQNSFSVGQAEAITYDAENDGFYLSSEGITFNSISTPPALYFVKQ